MIDAGNCTINDFPIEVSATCLGHALQRITHALGDDCTEVKVWKDRP